MPITNNLTLYRGQDATLEFTEAAASGDITEWAIKFTMTAKRNSATKLLEIDADIVDGETRRYDVLIPAAGLDRAPGTYFYDVWRTDTGEAVPLSVGTITIEGDSYRPASA